MGTHSTYLGNLCLFILPLAATRLEAPLQVFSEGVTDTTPVCIVNETETEPSGVALLVQWGKQGHKVFGKRGSPFHIRNPALCSGTLSFTEPHRSA